MNYEQLFEFQKKHDQTIYGYFHEHSIQNELINNCSRFFNILGQSFGFTGPYSIEKIFPNYRHQLVTASHYALKYNQFAYFFGYADRFRPDGTYMKTFCHSFVIDRHTKRLYDPYSEYHFGDQYPIAVGNFFGVHIPTCIVEEIFYGKDGANNEINILPYLTERIFTSAQATNEFIKKVGERTIRPLY